jgi:hypothetical protein
LELNSDNVVNGTGIDMVATYTCKPGYAFTGQYESVLTKTASFLVHSAALVSQAMYRKA